MQNPGVESRFELTFRVSKHINLIKLQQNFVPNRSFQWLKI